MSLFNAGIIKETFITNMCLKGTILVSRHTMKKKTVEYVKSTERAKALIAARNLKMAQSTLAYVRGSTLEFYEWLDHPDLVLPQGPAIWICGDCHSGNIGPIADAEGNIAIEIRDLDQTVIGNPTHDLIRLGLSLAMSARDSNLPGVTTAYMLEELMLGYELAFRRNGGGSTQVEQPNAIKIVMKKAVSRSWKHLAKERIGGIKPTFPLGKRFWPLLKKEKAAISNFFASDDGAVFKAALRPDGADVPIKVLDAAYWRKGCSSLGLLRYAVLIKFEDDSTNEGMYLIDIKEAVKTIAPRYNSAKVPRNNAKRVVEGARQLAPHLGERMIATRFMDRSVFLRELLPQDLKLDIGTLSRADARVVARFLGRIVGRAHARQMDAETKRSWHRELLHNHSKSLEAPTWLWSSVVGLIGIHERAYLEHCLYSSRWVQDHVPA